MMQHIYGNDWHLLENFELFFGSGYGNVRCHVMQLTRGNSKCWREKGCLKEENSNVVIYYVVLCWYGEFLDSFCNWRLNTTRTWYLVVVGWTCSLTVSDLTCAQGIVAACALEQEDAKELLTKMSTIPGKCKFGRWTTCATCQLPCDLPF